MKVKRIKVEKTIEVNGKEEYNERKEQHKNKKEKWQNYIPKRLSVTAIPGF